VDSIFASRTVRRFGVWVLSLVGGGFVAGVTTLGGLGYKWAESRASRTTVATEIARYATVSAEVRRQAAHGATLVDDHERQLAQLWEWQIAAQAELLVHRSYGRLDAARRAELIERAKRFYAHEWEAQRERHANDLAEAARQTMLIEWRPDR